MSVIFFFLFSVSNFNTRHRNKMTLFSTHSLPKRNGITTLFLIFYLLRSIEKCASEKILFYAPVGFSHRQSIEPLAHALTQKGHDVTFFSIEKPTRANPKIKEFVHQPLKTFFNTEANTLFHNFFKLRAFSKYIHPVPSAVLSYMEVNMCSLVLDSPDSGFQSWVKSSSFDLLVMDMSNQKCALGLAYKFGAKVIAFSPTGIANHENEIWGWHSDSSWAPTFALSNVFTKERTFYDRIFLTIYPLFSKFVINYVIVPRVDQVIREKLEIPEMPSLRELEEKASLLFVNTHPSNDYPRSFPPFVVPVGGMHCDVWEGQNKTRKLPQKMAEFIDGAGEDGFIFISFGSVIIQMSQIPEDILNIFFEAVRGRKTRFLWKWDVDPPKNTPENVFAAKWFPQQDLLAHPKIRGFITHGGMMSYQQSVAYGVPVIVIPMIYDQPFNGLHAQFEAESGIQLEFSELTVEKLGEAIDSILNDKKYKENAKIAQGRFLDRPQSPADLAVYWTEYVLRHKDTSHLKPVQAMAQFWWQKHLLDVWLFLLILTILSSWAALKILKCIFRRFSKSKGDLKSKTE